MFKLMPIALTAGLLVTFVGCSKNSGACVRGTVTCNGQVLAKGYITFYPAEGTDTTRGSEIVNGDFTVVNLTPGRKRVYITVPPEVTATDAKLLRIKPGQLKITSETPGNNQIVEVRLGADAMSFALGKQ